MGEKTPKTLVLKCVITAAWEDGIISNELSERFLPYEQVNGPNLISEVGNQDGDQ